jgi:hypothetical protein
VRLLVKMYSVRQYVVFTSESMSRVFTNEDGTFDCLLQYSVDRFMEELHFILK